jgi:hypothetical protein
MKHYVDKVIESIQRKRGFVSLILVNNASAINDVGPELE